MDRRFPGGTVSDTCTERLTRDNPAVLLIDHQVGLYSGIVDIPLAELKHNVVALTKAAQVLGRRSSPPPPQPRACGGR
jgi:hypothetical protein